MGDEWRKQKNKYFDGEMAFARKFDDEIMQILKKVFNARRVEIADKSNDINRNTDYLVYRRSGAVLRIAARVRRYEYLKYDNITIRSDLANNKIKHDGDTELQKMAEGWGDFGIYAIAAEDESHIIYYAIYDLDKVRRIYENGGLEDAPKKEAHNTGCGFISMPLDKYGSVVNTEWREKA